MYFGSTVRAVFGASRTGDKASAADFAPAHIFRIENVFFQLRLRRQDCATKVFTDKCVSNGLRTGTAFAIVQQEAVAIDVVATELNKSPDAACLFWCEAEQFSVRPSFNGFHLPDLITSATLFPSLHYAGYSQNRLD